MDATKTHLSEATAACRLWEWGRERRFPRIVASLCGVHRLFEGYDGWGAFIWFGTEEEIRAVLDACIESEGK